MLTTLWKICLPFAALALAACTSDTQQLGQPPDASDALYQLQPAIEQQALARAPGVDGYLKHLLQAPSTEDIRLVTLTPSRVSSTTRTLSLALPDGSTAQFNLLRINDSQPGMTGWIGDVASNRKRDFPSSSEVVMDPFNWISLMRQGDQVVGDIHVKGQAYRIEPIGNGQHVLVSVDESKLPPEAEPIPAPMGTGTDPDTNKAPSSAHSTIRVLFVTTNQSRVQYPNNRLRLAQALQDANQFLINSQVDLTYEIAGFYDAAYDETGQDSSAQLTAVRSDQTALGKAVYGQRDALAADLVAMLSTFKDACGRAYLNASKAFGYSVTSCLGGTLAHELGHNLGVNHGWQPGDSVPNPPYMHGYKRTVAPALHTVMVKSQGAIPYFSNPRLTYQGVAIGTVANHDAARRINERRQTVENFYPPLAPRTTTITVYDSPNMKGEHCTFAIPSTRSVTYIEDVCGRSWKSKVWSVRVKNANQHTTLRVGNNLAWHSYHTNNYLGDFDLSGLGQFQLDLPGDMSMDVYKGNLTKLVDRVTVL